MSVVHRVVLRREHERSIFRSEGRSDAHCGPGARGAAQKAHYNRIAAEYEAHYDAPSTRCYRVRRQPRFFLLYNSMIFRILLWLKPWHTPLLLRLEAPCTRRKKVELEGCRAAAR